MIEDEDHPEMKAAAKELLSILQRIGAGRRVSRQLFQDIITVRDEHKARWWAKGVNFPHTVIVAVPRLQIVELWRADVDISYLKIKVVNLLRLNPSITSHEIVNALQAAYPGIKNLDDKVAPWHEAAKPPTAH